MADVCVFKQVVHEVFVGCEVNYVGRIGSRNHRPAARTHSRLVQRGRAHFGRVLGEGVLRGCSRDRVQEQTCRASVLNVHLCRQQIDPHPMQVCSCDIKQRHHASLRRRGRCKREAISKLVHTHPEPIDVVLHPFRPLFLETRRRLRTMASRPQPASLVRVETQSVSLRRRGRCKREFRTKLVHTHPEPLDVVVLRPSRSPLLLVTRRRLESMAYRTPTFVAAGRHPMNARGTRKRVLLCRTCGEKPLPHRNTKRRFNHRQAVRQRRVE